MSKSAKPKPEPVPQAPDAIPGADGGFEEKSETGQVVLRGQRVNGLLDGKIERLLDGKPQQICHYSAGKLHGEVLTYAKSEKIVERATFAEDVLDGVLEKFDEKGVPLQRVNYRRGVIEGELKIYENGQVICRQSYVGGKQQGPTVIYNEQGKTVCEFLYQQGEKHGPAVYYSQAGRVVKKEQYQHNELHGDCVEYYENGSVREQGIYEKGKHQGEWLVFHPNGKLAKRTVFAADKPVTPPEAYDEKGRRLPAEAPPPAPDPPPAAAPPPPPRPTTKSGGK